MRLAFTAFLVTIAVAPVAGQRTAQPRLRNILSAARAEERERAR